MSRKGPAQSGFRAKPFDWHAWTREQKDKRRAYLERERLRAQLNLPLGRIAQKEICPACGCRRGAKCSNCNSTGFVNPIEEKIPPPCMLEGQPSVPRAMIECRRCWGTGQIANKNYRVGACPDCDGTGRKEAPVDG